MDKTLHIIIHFDKAYWNRGKSPGTPSVRKNKVIFPDRVFCPNPNRVLIKHPSDAIGKRVIICYFSFADTISII